MIAGMDHPAESQQALNTAIVVKVYPDTWEVDVQPTYGTSGIVRRVKVVSPFLPEVHTPERQSKVIIGRLDGFQQSPVAVPIHNTIIPPEQMAAHVYWSEHLTWRISITREHVIQILNTDTGMTLRGEREGPFWRLSTDGCSLLLDEAGQLVQLDAANIHLGEGANERLVLGEQLMAYLNELVTIFNAHKHVEGGNPPIPAEYTQPIFPLTALSEVSKTK